MMIQVVFAWNLLAWGAAQALMVHAGLTHTDVTVVLNGSCAYFKRMQKAAELYHQGRAPLVLMTNDNTRGGLVQRLQRNPLGLQVQYALSDKS